MDIVNIVSPRSLLIEAPSRRHLCQLHRSAESLSHAVAVFAETGLRRGDCVVLVASPERVARVRQRLGDAHADEWTRNGRLNVFDSDEMLDALMRAGMPDWSDFLHAVRRIMKNLNTPPGRRTRIYGDMVNELWRRRNAAAAIRLEEYWNRVAADYAFCLFCGYEIDHLDAASYDSLLGDIGRVHTDFPPSADDERFGAAVNAACLELLGTTLAEHMKRLPSIDAGERQLDHGRQTILWLKRHMPQMSEEVLARARRHFGA